MLQIKLLESITLERQPCCIAFSPIHPEIFIVGTYELKNSEFDGSIMKDGNLVVYHLEHGILQHVQTLSFSFAILDLRFSPNQPQDFAFATSIGTILIGTLASESGPSTDVLSRHYSVTITGNPVVVNDPHVDVTSLAFPPSDWVSSVIAATMSDGSIAVTNTAPPIMTSRKDGVHFLMHTPTAAWVAAWSARREILHPQFLYTGGDDSALRRHLVVDIPGGRKEFRNAPIFGTLQNDQTTHGAGVTAIVPLWTEKGDVMLTGSYDEYIRVLHIKKGRTKATIMAERRLDGGVWQLKLLQRPSNPQDPAGFSFPVLASCSQAGCKIVEIHCDGEGNWNIEVLAVFMDPQSIRPLYYASDFQVGLNGREVEHMTYVSTSFYDKKLCVWKVEDEEVEDEEREDEEVEVEGE